LSDETDMTISTRTRPRSEQERHLLAQLLLTAPRVVKLDFEDDGWVTAQLLISGREVVWGSGDPSRTEALLARLGLPALSTIPPEGSLSNDLTLHTEAAPSTGQLPRVRGPLVSLLICTYNRKDLLAEAVASARRQNWPIEIVVVDDGSTDGTADWLAGQRDLVVHIQPENRGKVHALNAGLSIVTGQALLILDDDDQLMPGAVATLAHTLFQSDQTAVVFGDAITVRQGVVLEWVPALRTPLSKEVVLMQVPGLTGAHLTRMSAQRLAGAFDPRLELGEDMDMFLRLSRVGPFETVPLATFLCRCHDGARGSSAHRHQKQSVQSEVSRTIAFSAPVFLERWQRYRQEASRGEGFAWAMGLFQRGLVDEALTELSRWSGPFERSAVWIREQCGLSSPLTLFQDATLVADDADPGALETLLACQPKDRELWVNLQVPRDPLGGVRLYAEGHYGAHQVLPDWVRHRGPIHLRLASSPDWAPPPISEVRWLPPISSGTDAILALAAALDFPRPSLVRRAAGLPYHPLALLCWSIRRALQAGQAQTASDRLDRLQEAYPDWMGTQTLRSAVESLAIS
jgi:glycosyltransferase involved in cell wall biosynthesis